MSNILTEEKLKELIDFSERVKASTGRAPFDIKEMLHYALMKYKISQGDNVGISSQLPKIEENKECIVNYAKNTVEIVPKTDIEEVEKKEESFSVTDDDEIDRLFLQEVEEPF
jgi:hypothetical protein